jgi:hypothetical protein
MSISSLACSCLLGNNDLKGALEFHLAPERFCTIHFGPVRRMAEKCSCPNFMGSALGCLKPFAFSPGKI